MLRCAQSARAQFAGVQFAAKSARGPICRGPICLETTDTSIIIISSRKVRFLSHSFFPFLWHMTIMLIHQVSRGLIYLSWTTNIFKFSPPYDDQHNVVCSHVIRRFCCNPPRGQGAPWYHPSPKEGVTDSFKLFFSSKYLSSKLLEGGHDKSTVC